MYKHILLQTILEQIKIQTELLDAKIDLELRFVSSVSQLALIKKIYQAILQNTDMHSIQCDLEQYKNACFKQSVLLNVFVKGETILHEFRQRLELPEDFTLDVDSSVLIPSTYIPPVSSSLTISALKSDAQQRLSERTDKTGQNTEISPESFGSAKRPKRLAAKIGLFGKAGTEKISSETDTIDEEPPRYFAKKKRGTYKKSRRQNKDLSKLQAKLRRLEENIALLQQEKKIYESITAKYLETDVHSKAKCKAK
jgi:hypothetical protein